MHDDETLMSLATCDTLTRNILLRNYADMIKESRGSFALLAVFEGVWVFKGTTLLVERDDATRVAMADDSGTSSSSRRTSTSTPTAPRAGCRASAACPRTFQWPTCSSPLGATTRR